MTQLFKDGQGEQSQQCESMQRATGPQTKCNKVKEKIRQHKQNTVRLSRAYKATKEKSLSKEEFEQSQVYRVPSVIRPEDGYGRISDSQKQRAVALDSRPYAGVCVRLPLGNRLHAHANRGRGRSHGD